MIFNQTAINNIISISGKFLTLLFRVKILLYLAHLIFPSDQNKVDSKGRSQISSTDLHINRIDSYAVRDTIIDTKINNNGTW